MKALIVAEDDECVKKISSVLKESGYETIIYRWLLKALDNLEEISPDVAVISTADYPRHWKVFAQFSYDTLSTSAPKIILYNARPLSNEDKKKADALCVAGSFDGVDVENLTKLKKIVLSNDSKKIDKIEENIQFMFKNPTNGAVITGKAFNFNGSLFDFMPDIISLTSNLCNNKNIQGVFLSKEKKISNITACVLSVGRTFKISILKDKKIV